MCHSCGTKSWRLAFKISVLRQILVIVYAKCTRAIFSVLVIICATRAGENLSILAYISSVLSHKFVIICATRTGENLSVLACKISVLRQKLVIICAIRAGEILCVLKCKISFLRKKLVIICATLAMREQIKAF